VNEYLVEGHLSDLRRDAATHGRVASRAGRAAPRLTKRVTSTLLHRRVAPVGCEA
jgi:hypothetical protein